MQIGKNNFYLKLVGKPNKTEYQIVLEIKDDIVIFENEEVINKTKNIVTTDKIKDIVVRHLKELTEMAMKADPTINPNNVLLITIGGFSLKISANKMSDYEKAVFNDILDSIFNILETTVGDLIVNSKDKKEMIFQKDDYEFAKLTVEKIINNNLKYADIKEEIENSLVDKEILLKTIDEKVDDLYKEN